ncbi:MAG: hypothetical protein FWD59_08685 [Micrococcales bacterium]|nr:hypothetical protein [Micrococcales bacterium]
MATLFGACGGNAPLLPTLPGMIERGTPDHVIYGTAAFFTALYAATGSAAAAPKPRHRAKELLAVFKQVTRARPKGELWPICRRLSSTHHIIVVGLHANRP